jgi:hypothetical protein
MDRVAAKGGGPSERHHRASCADAALARQLVDTKVAAIADWSGLKLVWRRTARD